MLRIPFLTPIRRSLRTISHPNRLRQPIIAAKTNYFEFSRTIVHKYGTWSPAELSEAEIAAKEKKLAKKLRRSSKGDQKPQATADENTASKRPVSTLKKDRSHTTLAPIGEILKVQSDVESKPDVPKPKPRQPSQKPTQGKKGDEAKEELGVNAQFRQTKIDPKIWDYIERNQFGRRRTTTTGKMKPNNIKHRTKQQVEEDEKFSVARQRGTLRDEKEKATLNAADEFFLVRNRLQLYCSATAESMFPPDKLVPEVAVIGRSNVGKSSLINSLADTTIVRVSDKPGETRAIDWFRLGDKFSLVDLPGYGFAYATPEQLETWRHLIRSFLTARKSLRRTLLLIDSRIGFKRSDLEMMHFLDSLNVTYQIVLTKSDLVVPVDLARRASIIKRELDNFKRAIKQIVILSSRTRQGVPHLRSHLLGLADVQFHRAKDAPKPPTAAPEPQNAPKETARPYSAVKKKPFRTVKPAKGSKEPARQKKRS